MSKRVLLGMKGGLGMCCMYLVYFWWEKFLFKLLNHIFLLNVHIDKVTNTYIILKRVVLGTQNSEETVSFTACRNRFKIWTHPES